MPRANPQRIVDQKVIDAISNPQALQPVASPVDQGSVDNSWLGVSQALSALNPKLQELVQINASEGGDQGEADRKLGLPPKSLSDPRYMERYNQADEYVKAKDGEAVFKADYAEMPKDGASLKDKNGASVTFDTFAANWVSERIKTLQNPGDLKVYKSILGEAVDKVRGEHRTALLADVTNTQKANTQRWMTDSIRQYTDKGLPIPTAHLDVMKQSVTSGFGTTGSEYNEMVMNSLTVLSNEGNYSVWDVTKENRPDGTPGIYHIPEMQKRILAAQNHSLNVFTQKHNQAEIAAKKKREDDLDIKLLDVFLLEDPKEKSKALDSLTKSGLFTRAADLLSARKQLEDDVDRKPSPEQGQIETDLLVKIYQGKGRTQEVINSNLVRSQRNYLLSQIRQVSNENRSAGIASQAAGKAIFNLPEFNKGYSGIKQALAPLKNTTDVFGVGTQFEQQQQDAAQEEFLSFARSQADKNDNDPSKLTQKKQEIVDRHLKLREKANQTHPYAGRLRYPTAQEALANAESMTNLERQGHIDYFTSQKKTK